MPGIVRAMRRDGQHPLVGASKNALGVVIGHGHNDDLPMNAQGLVIPKTGGMSVSPTWRDLPGHRIPRRLQFLCSKATGNNLADCWQLGEAPFIDGPVTTTLSLKIDHPAHGIIEPSNEMEVGEFHAALSATRERWGLIPETVGTNETLT